MIRFLGGPAAGVTMQLRRAPLFLRVVQDPNGDLDALDMLGDEPRGDDRLSVYKREGPRTVVHIDFSRGRGRNRSGWYVVATYRHFDLPPADDVLRCRAGWQAWCLERIAETTADSSKPSSGAH